MDSENSGLPFLFLSEPTLERGEKSGVLFPVCGGDPFPPRRFRLSSANVLSADSLLFGESTTGADVTGGVNTSRFGNIDGVDPLDKLFRSEPTEISLDDEDFVLGVKEPVLGVSIRANGNRECCAGDGVRASKLS